MNDQHAEEFRRRVRSRSGAMMALIVGPIVLLVAAVKVFEPHNYPAGDIRSESERSAQGGHRSRTPRVSLMKSDTGEVERYWSPMTTLRRHIGTILFVGIVLVVVLMVAVASGTPYFKWFRVLSSLALVILTARAWRERGREWLPTLSWAIPLTILWIAAQQLVDRPVGLVVFIHSLGLGVLLVMLVSTRAARWWYEVVLRRPFRG